MAEITKDQVLKTADLARIAISEEEAEMYSEQLTDVITFAEKINNLNTDDVKKTLYGRETDNVLRDDVPKHSITQEEALLNAPEKEDGQFKVPSIME